jgi:hypothetical protein
MTVELITGYSGAAHIDSSDVQHLIAGVVGPGSYVLQTQNKLSLTVNSANKVTLNTGDAVIAGGAHVRVSAAEALTVTSGTQGANRTDLVVLRYTKNSSNVESAQAVVIKGTATSGTASDPSYNTGSIIDGKTTVDMPLYRIPISGVNLGTPVKLFSEQPSMKALGDSVSQHDASIAEGGWKYLYQASYGSVRYTRRLGVLYIRAHVSGIAPDWWTAGTLPEGYRPQSKMYESMAVDGENQTAEILVDTDGSVKMISDQKNGSSTCWAMLAIPLW